MRKIRIAIIDSGINTSLLSKYVFGGCSILPKSDYGFDVNQNIEDEHGHGTGCAYAILRIEENVEFYTIKILNPYLKTSSTFLIQALEHLNNINIDIVNISVTTDIYSKTMEIVCDELRSQGKILLASKNNKNSKSYPAEFDSVIGVRGSIFKDDYTYWYDDKKTIQCVADMTPIWTPTIYNQFKYLPFSSNSKATPTFAGILSKIIQRGVSVNDINYYLKLNAKRSSWEEQDINTNLQDAYSFIIPENKASDKSLEIVKMAISKHTNFSDIEIDKMVSSPVLSSGITTQQYGMILYEIEQIYGGNLQFKNINAPNVNSLLALAKLLDD